jgi:hypothetical protein
MNDELFTKTNMTHPGDELTIDPSQLCELSDKISVTTHYL